MSISAAQAANFMAEVCANGVVWTIRDAHGFPSSTNPSGETAMPFWSLESRARTIVTNVPAYAGFEPYRLTLEEFRDRWLPGLGRDGLKAGLNWSGDRATGYDMEPSAVLNRLDSYRENSG